MLFFNKKEEVIDVQLTAYGKHLLSKGKFSPKYYCFFDDDVLYDSEKAGVTEEQNDTQIRILEETPKLKTQYSHYGISTFNIAGIADNENTHFDYNLQNKSLLYRLANQEISLQAAPNYDVLALDSSFSRTSSVEYQHFTSSGIIKNIPQLSSSVDYRIVKNIENPMPPRLITEEDNFDLAADSITFADNTSLHLTKSCLILDIEENNVYHGRNNFFLEIYEIESDEEAEVKILRRLDNMLEINSLFHIKTDRSVDHSIVKHRNEKQRNSKRRQD